MSSRAPLPLVTAALVAANLAVYGLELEGGGQAVCDAYGLVPAHFTPSALVTHLFLHDPGTLAHIGGNLVFLAFFGTIVERALGHLRFAALYLAAGVAGALVHIMVDPAAADALVGASGAIFGVFAVAAVLRPRVLGFVVAFVGVNLWYAFTGTGGAVSFGAHLGGFAVGALVAVLASVTGRPILRDA